MDNQTAMTASQGLVNPVNSVEQGYQTVNSQIMAAQNLHDNNMLKVFEFAANGDVDAAKAFAASKGINIPPEAMQNADMMQGLTIAGKMYPQDAAGAQRFSMAWMQNQGLPPQERVSAASQAAGPVTNEQAQKYQGMALALSVGAAAKGAAGAFGSRKSYGQQADEAGQAYVKTRQQAAAHDGLSPPPYTAEQQQKDYQTGVANFKATNPQGSTSPFTNTPPAGSGNTSGATGEINTDTGELNINEPVDLGNNSGPAPSTQAPSPPLTQGTSFGMKDTPITAPASGGATGGWGGAPAAAPMAPNSGSPPSLPAGVPPGLTPIGTIGGQTTYQDANGIRYQPSGTP